MLVIVLSLLIFTSPLLCSVFSIPIQDSLTDFNYALPNLLPTLALNVPQTNTLLNSKISHVPISGTDEGFISVNITSRGALYVVICVETNLGCSSIYDSGLLVINGFAVDTLGTRNYESFLVVSKPSGTARLSIYTMAGRGEFGPSTVDIEYTAQYPLCQRCPQTSCEPGATSCPCGETSFGRLCDKSISKMDHSPFERRKLLKPFETISIEESYEEGDKYTEIEIIRKEPCNNIFFVQNEDDGKNLPIVFRETSSEGRFSEKLVLRNFDQSGKYVVKLSPAKKWSVVTLQNLCLFPVELEVKVIRNREGDKSHSTLVVAIVIVVSCVVIAVTVAYLMCLKMANLKKMRVSPTQNRQQTPEVVEDPESEEEDEEIPEMIGEAEVEKYLPLITAQEVKKNDSNALEESCSICLESFKIDKPLRKVLFCSHLFHSECLLSWKNMHENCPNCKKDFSMKAIREFEKEELERQKKVLEKEKEVQAGDSPTKKPSRMKVLIDRRTGSSQVVRMDSRARTNRGTGLEITGMPRGTTLGQTQVQRTTGIEIASNPQRTNIQVEDLT